MEHNGHVIISCGCVCLFLVGLFFFIVSFSNWFVFCTGNWFVLCCVVIVPGEGRFSECCCDWLGSLCTVLGFSNVLGC